MIIVGVPYSAAGLMNMKEITGGTPYGATTLAGSDGKRKPSQTNWRSPHSRAATSPTSAAADAIPLIGRRGRGDGEATNQLGSMKGDSPIRGAPTRVFEDLYHFLVTASWPALIALIAVAFTVANLLFAAGYYLDGASRMPRSGSFADMFFFSVQTMATIGYGKMVPVTLFSNILVSIEALTGLLALALMTGLVFSNSRAPRRASGSAAMRSSVRATA